MRGLLQYDECDKWSGKEKWNAETGGRAMVQRHG